MRSLSSLVNSMIEHSVLMCFCLFAIPLAFPAHAQSAKKSDIQPSKQTGANRLESKISAATEAFKGQHFEEAARLFKEVVTQDPKHALAWHFLGQSLEKTGRKQEARSAYEKSLELQPAGTLGERNRAMLSQLRPGAEPQLPPELSPDTRNIVLKNPLFIASPGTVGLKCTRTGWLLTVSTGKRLDMLLVTTYKSRSDGLVEYQTDSLRKSRTGEDGIGIGTLGGLLDLVRKSQIFGEEVRSSTEILKASGSLFPLKSGNSFSIKYASRIRGAISTINDKTCEVLDVVKGETAKRILGTEDAHRVRCREKIDSIDEDGAKETERNEYFHVCSNALGICPLSWEIQAGEDVPDFAGGFTYLKYDTNYKTYIRMTCSPAN